MRVHLHSDIVMLENIRRIYSSARRASFLNKALVAGTMSIPVLLALAIMQWLAGYLIYLLAVYFVVCMVVFRSLDMGARNVQQDRLLNYRLLAYLTVALIMLVMVVS